MRGGAEQKRGRQFVPVAVIQGPLLIVAEAAAVARRAPCWSAELEAAGIEYRVRLPGAGPGRVAVLVAEARSIGARTIAAAGGDDTVAAARAAAAATAVRFVQFSTGADGVTC